ncbi:hypothetical protein [Microbacterium aurantiacum]|uniref:hypothetical protein n=1 Tax=Microbacterium aurantiacum TaxID=162393 RepID=UPI000C80F63E|nr:hypothetical protein [Microbacterium aurantiacum]
MTDTEPVLTGWTQVDITSRGDAAAQRVIAAFAVVAGVAGVVIGFLFVPDWWAVALMVLACLVVVVIGLGLWFGASLDSEATEQLQATGHLMSLPVLAATETSDESVSFRLELAIPTDGGPVKVEHSCSRSRCTAAARAVPTVELPALVDAATKTWGIDHKHVDN